MSEEIIDLKRRNFIKGSAAAAATAGVATTSAFGFGAYESALTQKEEKMKDLKNAKYVPIVCGMCVNMCSVIARNVDGNITKIDPNPLNPKNRSFMCARGNAGVAAAYDPDRLQTPMIRVEGTERGSGKYRKATWEEALNYISKKMVKILDEEKDNRSTFVFGAGASTDNMGDPIFANFLNGVGGFFIDHFSTCFAPAFLANKLTYGSWGLGDFERTKYMITFGGNRTGGIVTPDTLDLFRHTHKRGLEKVVYFDLRYSNTAAHADEFVPIKPGTDAVVILAMINETIKNKYHKTPYKTDYLKKSVKAGELEELEEYFLNGEGAKYTPEWAEKISDVPASTIKRITKEFSDAAEKYEGAANCYRSRKSTWYYQDFDYRRAQAIFNVLHGTVNRPGGVLLGRGLKLEKYEYEDFPIYDRAQTRLDVSYAQKQKGTYPLLNPTKGSWQILRDAILDINTRWEKAGKPRPDEDGNYKGLKEGEYPVRGGFFYKQNPLQSVPDFDKTAEAFKTMDLIVVIDVIPNDTAVFADVILPDTSYLEREELVKSFGNLAEPTIVHRAAAMKPMYKSRPIFEMLKPLSKKIEKPFASISFKYTWDEEELGAKLPKDFDLAKYLTDDFEVDEKKLKADIKDDKLVKAILTHASEDDLDIATFKISQAFDKTVAEFNEEVMTDTYGKEAWEITKEYGVYWPGIEKAIADGVVDEKTKTFKESEKDKNAVYEIYRKYCTLPRDYFIVPKKEPWINLALKSVEGKEFINPMTNKKDKLGKFPKWIDDMFYEVKKDEFRVTMGRESYFTQSAHVNNYMLLDLMNYNYIWLNDKWAEEKGIKFKDEIELTNREGVKVRGKVYPTKKIRNDCIFIPTGFGSEAPLLTLGYHNGVSQAKIQENCIDPIIGSASMNETIVTIKKV